MVTFERFFKIILLVFMLLKPFGIFSQTQGPPKVPTVLVGTSWIKVMVEEISENKIQAVTLIPPAMCPGHFDLKPSNLQSATDCSALIIHAWQQTLPNVAGLIRADVIRPEKVKVLDVQGNLLIAEKQVEALRKVSLVCEELLPDQADAFRKKTQERTEEIELFASRLKDQVQPLGLDNIAVVSQIMQMPFIEWLGFKVVSSFERSEDRSAAVLARCIEQARSTKAALVIDNLQSGDPETGELIAREIQSPRVVLTNFPNGFPETETYEKTVKKNISLILKTLEIPYDVFF